MLSCKFQAFRCTIFSIVLRVICLNNTTAFTIQVSREIAFYSVYGYIQINVRKRWIIFYIYLIIYSTTNTWKRDINFKTKRGKFENVCMLSDQSCSVRPCVESEMMCARECGVAVWFWYKTLFDYLPTRSMTVMYGSAKASNGCHSNVGYCREGNRVCASRLHWSLRRLTIVGVSPFSRQVAARGGVALLWRVQRQAWASTLVFGIAWISINNIFYSFVSVTRFMLFVYLSLFMRVIPLECPEGIIFLCVWFLFLVTAIRVLWLVNVSVFGCMRRVLGDYY